MKRNHSEAFGQESRMPSTSGSESQFINAMFLCENAKLLGEHVSPPPTLQTVRVCNQSLPAYQPWEYRKMTIHSEKVVFLSQLKAHKQNKNLFGAENLNIDSRSFQESKICHKTILFFCL